MSSLCGVDGCSIESKYICPRCSLPYCSLPCYQKHSEPCTTEFHSDVTRHLQGRTVSEEQRRQFNLRIRESQLHTDSQDRKHVGDSNIEYESIQHNEEDNTDSDSGDSDKGGSEKDTRVLEQFITSLDEKQRDALFTALNNAMSAQSQTLPSRGNASASEASLKEQSSPKLNASTEDEDIASAAENDAEGNIADTLEELIDEMDALDWSYEGVLNRLPPSLREQFQKELQTGKLESGVQPWVPWWQYTSDNNNDDDSVPPLPDAENYIVPPEVAQRKASTSLRFGVIDLLASYAFSLRVCNGDIWTDAFGAQTMFKVCATLHSDGRYNALQDVYLGIMTSLTAEENESLATTSLADAAEIIGNGSEWIIRALFEMMRQMETLIAGGKQSRRERAKAVRKVAFYMAWATCQDRLCYDALAKDLLCTLQRESEDGTILRRAGRVVGKKYAARIEVLPD